MKQKTYSGYGIGKMMDTAAKHGLSQFNTTLYVKDDTDLNSFWRITVNGVRK